MFVRSILLNASNVAPIPCGRHLAGDKKPALLQLAK